jgi:PAS domain S-box-containing protein
MAETGDKYRAIVETSLDGIYQVDRSGRFMFINESFANMSGYVREELVGKHFADLLSEGTLPRIAGMVEDVFSGKNVRDEAWVKHRDGHEIPVIFSATPLRANGKIIGLTGILRDITERRQLEEALRLKEEYFQAIIENSMDGILVLDREGAIKYESPSFERLWGYKPQERVGKSGFEFVHPDDMPKMKEVYAKLAQHLGSNIRAEARVRHGDGSWHEIDAMAQSLLDHPAVQGIVLNIRDITELKRSEEAQHEAEEWCSALIDNTRDAIVVIQDGIIKSANHSLAELLGYSMEELIGKRDVDMITPEYQDSIALRYQGRLDGTIPPSNIELKIKRKDRQTRYIEASGTIITYQGKPADMGIVRDITERKRAEEALAQSEEWHRALVETAGKGGQAIIVLQNTPDREARVVFANDTACEMSGYTPAEVLSLSAWDVIQPSELNETQERYRLRQRGKKITSYYETTLRRKDGTAFPVEASVSTMTYQGNIASVLFFKDITQRREVQQELDDYRQRLETLVSERTAELERTNEQLEHEITERKQIEQVLRESEEYFRSLIENLQEVIVVIDGHGTIRYQSPSAQRVTKYSPKERQGKNILDFMHPDDLPHLARGFEEMLASPGSSMHAEWRGLWNDGLWHYVEGSALNLLHDPIVAGVVINFRDITERKQAENKQRELYEHEKELRFQLEVEMKKRVEFTRALAHELKTPLTSMLMSSQILSSELKDKTLLKLARNIARGATNLNTRIDELLDLARGEIGMLRLKTELFDIRELLKEVTEFSSPVASSRSQSLMLELPDSPLMVKADDSRLRQVLLNLLNNALKFTPTGSQITLKAAKKGTQLLVEVRDNGPGISKEEQQDLFEPYRHTKRNQEESSGLGIGLALCKMLVELHGGRISVKSSLGEGSTFGFTLPLELAGPTTAL